MDLTNYSQVTPEISLAQVYAKCRQEINLHDYPPLSCK